MNENERINGNLGGAPIEEKVKAMGPPQFEAPGGNISAEAQIQATIEPGIRLIVGTMMHGIVSTSGNIPPHILLNTICKVTASIAASAIASPDLAVLLNTRRGFKEAFDAGIASVNKSSMAPPGPGLVKG